MQEFQRGTVGANVLVAFEASAVSFLFDKSNNFGDFTNYVQGNPEAYLFGYQSPRNMIQFEHSYGYKDGGAGGGASVFNLKIIDPEAEFENRFLKNVSMHGMATEAFSVDLNELKTKDDFLTSPYSDWWKEKYGENYQKAKDENEEALGGTWTSWGPDYNGKTTWPRVYDFDGGTPGYGAGNGIKLDQLRYQILVSSAEENANEEWRYDGPYTSIKVDDESLIPPDKPKFMYCRRVMDFKKEEDKEKFEKETEDQTAKELTEAIAETRQELAAGTVTKVYIAYGMGSDFSTWAGPFMCDLMQANNEYDAKGVRTLSLEFVASVGSLGSGQREGAYGAGFNKKVRVTEEFTINDFNRYGRGQLEEKSGDEIKAVVNSYKSTFDESFAEEWIKEHQGVTNEYFNIDEAKMKPYRFVAGHIPGDIHLAIRSLITNYAHAVASQGQVPKGNIIVLLPNLDIGLASIQNAILSDVLHSGGIRADKEGRYWRGVETGVWNANLDTSNREYLETNINPQISSPKYEVSMRTVWGFLVVKTLIEALGLDFTMTPREGELAAGEEGKWLGRTEDHKLSHLPNLSVASYKEADPKDRGITEGSTNNRWSDALVHYFGRAGMGAKRTDSVRRKNYNEGKSRLKFEATIQNRFEENFEETLYRVLGDLEKNSSIQISPKVIWEEDMNILRKLEQYGVIATASEPVLLVGSESMINHFVYGHLMLMETFHEKTAISDFLKYIHPSDSERFSVRQTAPVEADAEEEGKSDFYPYCQDVFDYMYGIGKGGFSNIFLPTEFTKDSNNAQNLAAAGVPVFKSGYANSNILSMKMDIKPYYLAGLSFNFIAEQGKAVQRGTGGPPDTNIAAAQHIDLVSKHGLSQDAVDELLRLQNQSAYNINDDVLQRLSTMSKELFGFSINRDKNGDSQDYKNFMYFMLGVTGAQTNSGKVLTIPQQGGVNAFESVKRMVDYIANQTIKGAIKTIPYFRLSGLKSLARPIIMNVREVRSAGIKGNTSAFTTAIYSGFWNVFGFKHIITNKEAYSEFTVVKQGNNIGYKKVVGLTDKQQEAMLQASLESGEQYTTTDVLNATNEGGSLVDNLKETIGGLNQEPNPESGWDE